MGERPAHTGEASGSNPLPPTTTSSTTPRPAPPLLVVLLAAVTLLVGACGIDAVVAPASEPGRASAPAPDTSPPARAVVSGFDAATVEGIAETLDAAADAFRRADPDALGGVLLDPDSAFGQRWRMRAEQIGGVPLDEYRLELEPVSGDLATTEVRQRHEETVHVVHVRERHAIAGYDPDGPAIENLFLTVVDTADGWRIASDRDAEPLGLVSATHLWDIGPVTVTEGGPFVVLHHPDVANVVPPLLAEARRALDDMRPRWGLEWGERSPIILPRSQEELARLLNVTFALDNFIAFATSTLDGELGAYRLGGSRVVVNPDRFLDRPSATRQRILAHELLHVATRPYAGPFTPAWVEEGVAQRLGEDGPTTGLGLLRAEVARGYDGELPLDAEFTLGGRDRIWLSYQVSYSFAAYLADAHGEEALARFYAELGRGSVGEPGRRSHHLERAARDVYGASLDELRASWLRSLRGG